MDKLFIDIDKLGHFFDINECISDIFNSNFFLL